MKDKVLPLLPKSNTRVLSNPSFLLKRNDQKSKLFISSNRSNVLSTGGSRDCVFDTPSNNSIDNNKISELIEKVIELMAPPIYIKVLTLHSEFSTLNNELTRTKCPNSLTYKSITFYLTSIVRPDDRNNLNTVTVHKTSNGSQRWSPHIPTSL